MATKKGHEITMAEALASVIEGQGEWRWSSVTRQVSARIPVTTLARVDAMAAVAKKSRNAMLENLLAVGMEAVLNNINDEDKLIEIQHEEMQALERFSEDVEAAGGFATSEDEED